MSIRLWTKCREYDNVFFYFSPDLHETFRHGIDEPNSILSWLGVIFGGGGVGAFRIPFRHVIGKMIQLRHGYLLLVGFREQKR